MSRIVEGKNVHSAESISYIIHPPASRLQSIEQPITTKIDRPSCRAFLGHHNAVTRLAYHDWGSSCGRLFSASKDASVREWMIDGLQPTCQRIYVGHSNWVNDLATVPNQNGVVLISASNDKTIRVWKSPQVETVHLEVISPKATLLHHTDYITAVTAAIKSSPCLIASGGNDHRVAIWDLEKLVPVLEFDRRPEELCPSTLLKDTGGPVYIERGQTIRSLQLSENGRFLSYATGRELTVLDTRINKPIYGIKEAHSDWIRRFHLYSDGYRGISTCSDGSVFVWDFRYQTAKPQREIELRGDSVWALWADRNDHQIFFTGDRQGTMFGFRDDNDSCFWMGSTHSDRLKELPESLEWTARSVLDMTFDPQTKNLWVSSGDSNISCWNLGHLFGTTLHRPNSIEDVPTDSRPAQTSSHIKSHLEPTCVISGFPKFRQFRLLRDQRTLVTQSLFFEVETWDVIEGSFLDSFGHADFEDVVNRQQSVFLSLPLWCSIDIIRGCIRVTLKAHTAFSAEILKPSSEQSSEQSINYGCMVLDRLFSDDRRQHNTCALVTLEACRAVSSDSIHDNAIWTCLSCEFNSERLKIPLWVFDWVINFISSLLPALNSRPSRPKINLPVNVGPRSPKCVFSAPDPPNSCFAQIANFIASSLKIEPPPIHASKLSRESSFRPSALVLTCMGETLQFDWDIGTVRDLIWRKNQVKGKRRPFEIQYDLLVVKKLSSVVPSSSSLFSRILTRKNKQSVLTLDES